MVVTAKIRESVELLQDSQGVYHVLFSFPRVQKTLRLDELASSVLETLVEETDVSVLIKKEPEKVKQILSSLEQLRIIRLREQNPSFSQREKRQIEFIDEFSGSYKETLCLQKEIREKKITVFGVGGIGTWIINGLYQLNVNDICAVDFDRVEESNINRQLYFTTQDVGRYKVDVIKEKLPDANIHPIKEELSSLTDLDSLLLGTDFVINCADNPSIFETSQLIDSWAQKTRTPYIISGGYSLHQGFVGPIIVPGVTASLEDYVHFHNRDDEQKYRLVKPIEQPGNIGPTAGVIANMQLIELFKHFINNNSHYNHYAEIDFIDGTVDWIDFTKK